ncbi:poly(U)-specific 3'-to-5' RNA exonuclease [Geranomyces variabilis]|uniref:U6 snRNA phosphodiesterase 1 n=1 Tax=Geranomyces variabilis TaxID=109894 RepID=A0AAD5XL21_9FUNG|nr:poly(U)-specific 3'-to-5' RNA exonuclease [Geranomyces variabilis]
MALVDYPSSASSSCSSSADSDAEQREEGAASKYSRTLKRSPSESPAPTSKRQKNAGNATAAGPLPPEPLIPGNWVTYIYLSFCPSATLDSLLSRILAALPEGLGATAIDRLLDPGSLHISLSRTVYIKEFQIPQFVETLNRSYSQQKRAFPLRFHTISAYVNDDATRSFLGLDVSPFAGCVELTVLSAVADKAMAAFGRQKYYDVPLFHASFASAPGKALVGTAEALADEFGEELRAEHVDLGDVTCRIGHKVWRWPLRHANA